MKTLAEELKEENKRLRRRVVHATRPKRALTLDEARLLHEALIGSSKFQYDVEDENP